LRSRIACSGCGLFTLVQRGIAYAADSYFLVHNGICECVTICVSETWFVQSLCDVLISCDGYNVYRSDGVSHGGGVAIYVNKKLKAKIICQHTINSAIEYIFFLKYKTQLWRKIC